jgi:hypothetical protein
MLLLVQRPIPHAPAETPHDQTDVSAAPANGSASAMPLNNTASLLITQDRTYAPDELPAQAGRAPAGQATAPPLKRTRRTNGQSPHTCIAARSATHSAAAADPYWIHPSADAPTPVRLPPNQQCWGGLRGPNPKWCSSCGQGLKSATIQA